jgi:hypothetical protein
MGRVIDNKGQANIQSYINIINQNNTLNDTDPWIYCYSSNISVEQFNLIQW